jgi:hypothetical protein
LVAGRGDVGVDLDVGRGEDRRRQCQRLHGDEYEDTEEGKLWMMHKGGAWSQSWIRGAAEQKKEEDAAHSLHNAHELRVVAPGVERWGVGTSRKPRGKLAGRFHLPLFRGLPNDTRGQLPRGLAAQENRLVPHGVWGSQRGP